MLHRVPFAVEWVLVAIVHTLLAKTARVRQEQTIIDNKNNKSKTTIVAFVHTFSAKKPRVRQKQEHTGNKNNKSKGFHTYTVSAMVSCSLTCFTMEPTSTSFFTDNVFFSICPSRYTSLANMSCASSRCCSLNWFSAIEPAPGAWRGLGDALPVA
jgi:hypothetical protein